VRSKVHLAKKRNSRSLREGRTGDEGLDWGDRKRGETRGVVSSTTVPVSQLIILRAKMRMKEGEGGGNQKPGGREKGQKASLDYTVRGGKNAYPHKKKEQRMKRPQFEPKNSDGTENCLNSAERRRAASS